MSEPRLRKAARAVVLDPDDRIFLVHMQLKHVNFWTTPGGGIEHGETPSQALRRELHEEVGRVEFDIGPHIWTSSRVWQRRLSPDYEGQTNTIFLVRVDSPDLGASLLSDAELRAEAVIDRRWWTLPELESATTEFSPTMLPGLLADLINSGPPTIPINVGF